jgi:hypothetical protein
MWPQVSSPDVRFVIVPRRPRAGMLAFVVALAWLGSLWAAFEVSRHYAVPDHAAVIAERDQLAEQLATASVALEQERQRVAVLGRSDQVSRAANLELQQTLGERDEEIAALRGDLAFFERLVGGSAKRNGIAVHDLSLVPNGGGNLHYAVTLTQTLKRSGTTNGAITLQIEGIHRGKLSTLDWPALRQGNGSEPQTFAFRYFQQLEGSIMLPEDFTPHRVRVKVETEGNNRVERLFPWQDLLPPQQGA